MHIGKMAAIGLTNENVDIQFSAHCQKIVRPACFSANWYCMFKFYFLYPIVIYGIKFSFFFLIIYMHWNE